MEAWGYTWEAVKVQTDDGYILTTFHITGYTNGIFIPRDPYVLPVMTMRDVGEDSVAWINFDPQDSLTPTPLRLYDDGYDVWMANNRGTKYSQQHEFYTIDDNDYWQFSFAEMGLYDVPANIEKI